MSVITEPAARRVLRLAVAPIRDVVVRDATAAGDGSWTVEGYAAVHEQETTLFEIPEWWRVREEIARGAFDSVLERVRAGDELVHLNHGHDMTSAVAATNVKGVGGLELDADFHGLRYFARVDPIDPDAQRMAAKMRLGVVAQASFAFTIARETLVESVELEDGTLDQLWRIEEVGHLYDVCVCAQGAYPQTESYIRSLAAASLRTPDPGVLGRGDAPGHGRRGVAPGDAPIAPAPTGDPAGGSEHGLLRLQADAAMSVRTRGTKGTI